ncbi:hypothetical protein ACG0Z6_14350 [Roseateles sp. BYS180W]|uniref:Uncharacterized protein n=1 Tax=Roseateles rivi TaxID=3299028 RepID=A0ABW7FYM2_9BURK
MWRNGGWFWQNARPDPNGTRVEHRKEGEVIDACSWDA